MKLLILSKFRKGKKSFTLSSPDEFGYNIECTDAAGTVLFNNITEINWLNEGVHVYLIPKPIPGRDHYDFTKYDKVNIRKAKANEAKDFISHLGQ